ncbi:sorbosone dehydrogenase family protein [Cupriavidus sp. 2TAF22]|uniref:PQQ-dependent sugar dehydrogenase n=1 Tax=unclassified Cupriavidus TaxID=2640874 RepID=UPI003F8FDC03
MIATLRHTLCRLLGACSLFLAACGGGGDGAVSVSGGGTGTLSVVISGLPAGIPANVTVTGPGGYRQTLGVSTTLANLVAGTYTVTAANVLTSSASYRPQLPVQTIAVAPGTAPVAGVIYGPPVDLRLALNEVAGGLQSPVFLTAPGGDARVFVVERPGRIRIVRNGALSATPFLDIGALTTNDGERGLLSMAFDPGYATNGRFYVYYTDLNGAITIARYGVSAGNPDLADAAGTVVLAIPHSAFNNHNGGQLAFGPDGMLYIGTGDGGGTGDPSGNAQNPNVLLGKMLRIDVSGAGGQPYTMPSTNPFAGGAGGRGEIWALGLRNPWRFSFDTTGLIYIADVGQDQREEIDVAPASSAGLNYGWNRTEGVLCEGAKPCNTAGLTLPVSDYAHSAGDCAIVGGYVYRGSAIPELQGRYFYSDLCAGKLLSLMYRDGAVTEQVDWQVTAGGSVLSFGQDAAQELYVLADPATSATSGKVYRVERAAATP